MKTTLTMLKTAAAATLLAAASAQATTIDFDAVSVTSQLHHINALASYWGNNYSEDGFQLKSSGSFGNSLVVADLTYNAGSYAMGATPLAKTTLTGSSAFSVSSIDLLRVPSRSDWSVIFTGTKADASTVSQSFTFNTNSWTTFTFGAGFTNLTSLSWKEGGLLTLYAFDDINVSAVPEPETYAMMLAGLGLVALARRRKSA